jgi:hypothetical protein
MIEVGRGKVVEALPVPVITGNVIAIGFTTNAYHPLRFESEHPFWYSRRTI